MALKVQGDIILTLEEITPLIDRYVQEKHGFPVTSIEIQKNKIVAYVDAALDGLKQSVAKSSPQPKDAKVGGFKHVWEGFYSAIGEILDAQRRRKKRFISYDELLAEMHEMESDRGEKLFIKGGEKLPMAVLRHRLAPSQIVRQAKGQPNLRSVTNDKKNRGLKF